MARNVDFKVAPEELADVEGIGFSYNNNDEGDAND
jgi:hypothetical protein